MPDKPHWAKDLTSSGLHYFKGIVSDIEGILEEHRRETHSTFGTRTSKKFELGVGVKAECSIHQTEKENEGPNKVWRVKYIY